jgi:hypothetical protein
MLAAAGANRVYAATSLLRKQAGLGDCLESDGEGYGLAAGLEVMVFRDR